MGEDSDKEVDLEVAGQKVRARGYRLIDLVWLPMVIGLGYCVIMLQQHDARAGEEGRNVAQSVKEANVAVVNALKENNAATVQALKDLAVEQKKSTAAMRETACLLDPAVKNRPDGREFCKRMTRDDR